jgi:hypothetical protein
MVIGEGSWLSLHTFRLSAMGEFSISSQAEKELATDAHGSNTDWKKN